MKPTRSLHVTLPIGIVAAIGVMMIVVSTLLYRNQAQDRSDANHAASMANCHAVNEVNETLTFLINGLIASNVKTKSLGWQGRVALYERVKLNRLQPHNCLKGTYR